MDLPRLITFLQENYAVVEKAPWVFATFGVLCLVIGFALAAALNHSANAAKDQRLSLAQEEAKSYRDKLDGKTPEEVANRLNALEQQLKHSSALLLDSKQSLAFCNEVAPLKLGVEVLRDMASVSFDAAHRQMVSLFRDAGWVVHEWVSLSAAPGTIADVTLWRSEQTDENAVLAIQAAYKAVGVDLDVRMGGGADVMPRIMYSLTRR